MAQQQAVLPAGYRQILYAQNNNMIAYVTLPYGYDATDQIEIMGALDTAQAGEHWLVGSKTWNQGGNRRIGIFGTSNGSFAFAFGTVGTPNERLIPKPPADGQTHIATYSNYMFRLYDGGIDSVMDVQNITFGGITDELLLFKGYNSCMGKIYYFNQVKLSGERLHVIPIQHIASGAVEMYDTISKTIMTRYGTLYAPE